MSPNTHVVWVMLFLLAVACLSAARARGLSFRYTSVNDSQRWKMPTLDSYLPTAASYKVSAIPIFDNSPNDPNINVEVTKSYAGYINVGNTSTPEEKQNIFFWYFPSAKNTSRELIVYLNGGPGCSSLIGLFMVNGPIMVQDAKFVLNPDSWHRKANIVYVDQPFFTGFSFSSTGTLLTNQEDISNCMHTFITRFMYIFPALQNLRVILAGESFAGQYIPYLARKILIKNTAAVNGSGFIRLSAVSIGSPWFDPQTQYASYLDFSNLNNLSNGNATVQAIFEERHQNCLATLATVGELTYVPQCNDILDEISLYVSTWSSGTKCFNYYEMSKGFGSPKECVNTITTEQWMLLGLINDQNTREAIHVNVPGATSFFLPCSATVWTALSPDGSLPSHAVLFMLASNGLPTFIISGTDDFLVNHIGIERAIQKNWTGFPALQNWTVNGSAVGKVQKSGALNYFLINSAGHYTIFLH